MTHVPRDMTHAERDLTHREKDMTQTSAQPSIHTKERDMALHIERRDSYREKGDSKISEIVNLSSTF